MISHILLCPKQICGDIMERIKFEKGLQIYYGILVLIVAFVCVSQLKLQNNYQTNQKIIHSQLEYDQFRKMEIHPKLIELIVNNPCKNYIGYLTYEMLTNRYSLLEKETMNQKDIFKQIRSVENSDTYEELYYYYQMIFPDLKYFPIPSQKLGEEYVSYEDSWGAQRTYGGKRLHEGTDLMASNNKRGFFPIISVSDGIVEKKGWLSQGGWRIGVRAPSGAYFYYAHLYSYADGLEEGDQVKAGQLLGFMGDSGYGDEGTIGQFDVHLHFGIYIDSKEGEMSVNPYYILKYLEDHRLTCDYS